MPRTRTTKIVLLGAGNVATGLALRFFEKGFYISQVYSRTEFSATLLAGKIGASYTTSVAGVNTEADLYVCALKDDVLPAVLEQLPCLAGTIVHTAGSVDMSVFKGKFRQCGVLYPLQTFSKATKVDVATVPFFVEANNSETLSYLQSIASLLTEKVYVADSDQRKMLHLAAVFACNFVNRMYAIADEIVGKTGFDVDILLPLIDETARKVHQLNPLDAQTGPAIRFDKTVIDKQIALLADNKAYQEIYRIVSENIHETRRNEF